MVPAPGAPGFEPEQRFKLISELPWVGIMQIRVAWGAKWNLFEGSRCASPPLQRRLMWP
jgi:hypothetical protein